MAFNSKVVGLALTALVLAQGMLGPWKTVYAEPAKSGGFQYSYAYDNCTVWKGPGLMLVLQNTPVPKVAANTIPPMVAPHYRVALWTENAELKSGQWVALAGAMKPEAHGTLTYCQDKSICLPKRGGKVRMTQITKSKISGEVSVPNGPSIPFSAPILSYKAQCGY